MVIMFLGSIVFCIQIFGFFNDGDWTPLPGTYYFYVNLPEKDSQWSDYLSSRGFSNEQIRKLTGEQRNVEASRVERARKLLGYIPHGLFQGDTWWEAPESAIGFHNFLVSVLDALGMSGTLLLFGFVIFIAGLYWI